MLKREYCCYVFFMTTFFALINCQTTQVFYNPNVKGTNQLYSVNVSASANFTSQNVVNTGDFGDGSGLGGPNRAAQSTAQNENFIFMANEVKKE